MSGLVADARTLVDHARVETQVNAAIPHILVWLSFILYVT
jgi:hypothetical protein